MQYYLIFMRLAQRPHHLQPAPLSLLKEILTNLASVENSTEISQEIKTIIIVSIFPIS